MSEPTSMAQKGVPADAAGEPEERRPKTSWGFWVAVGVSLAVLTGLGVWQLHRAAWKNELLDTLAARAGDAALPIDTVWAAAAAGEDVRFQRVRVTGVYDPSAQVGVAAVREGVAGWRLVAPLWLSDQSGVVLVDRGFTPRTPQTVDRPPRWTLPGADADAAVSSDTQTALQPVRLEGVVRPRAVEGWFSPPPSPERGVFYTLAPEPLMAAFGASDQAPPFVVSAVSETPAADTRASAPVAWPPAIEDIANRHLEYAFTWFGLAATLVVIAGVFQRRRPR